MSTYNTPLITVASTLSASNTPKLLDKSKGNWPTWSYSIIQSLQLCVLGGYLTSRIQCPYADTEMCTHNNWHLNNKISSQARTMLRLSGPHSTYIMKLGDPIPKYNFCRRPFIYNIQSPNCKGTSIHSLTSLVSHYVYMYSQQSLYISDHICTTLTS
jgi:hypothetical protein